MFQAYEEQQKIGHIVTDTLSKLSKKRDDALARLNAYEQTVSSGRSAVSQLSNWREKINIDANWWSFRQLLNNDS